MTTEVRASHLLVQTEEEAKKLREEILNGKKFEDVAAEVSMCPSGANGGDLGFFGKGVMVKEFEDAAFSMNREEFAAMVKSVRNVEKALGKVHYPTDPKQIKGRQFSRSLYVAEDMKAGDVITEKNVRSVRPGYGLHPKYLPEILGKKVNRDLTKGTRFSLGLVE